MTFHKRIAAVFIASTMLTGAAYAANQDGATSGQTDKTVNAMAMGTTKKEKTVDRDVGRLSADGMQALRDVQETRIAIFNAQPDQAKTLIAKAKDAMQKAGKDDSAFMKAASDLEGPIKQDAKAGSQTTNAKDDQNAQVAWLPVDTQLTLGEGFQATPEKIAAITDANKSLQASDRDGAMKKLKLADVDVQIATAVVPLDQTTTDVNKAADLIDQGKFYEANAALKNVTDHVMLYVVDIDGQPYKAAKMADTKKADATASTTDAKPAAKAN